MYLDASPPARGTIRPGRDGQEFCETHQPEVPVGPGSDAQMEYYGQRAALALPLFEGGEPDRQELKTVGLRCKLLQTRKKNAG